MSKLTLSSLTSGLSSISKLNANFAAIVAILQDRVLFRDNPVGEPNQMESDLDMNSNAISNASSISTQALTVAGENLVVEDMAVISASYFYTPELAGAIGDGATNDTAALQAALDTCLETGKILQLGNRQYMASNLTITRGSSNKGPLIVQGHGAPQNFTDVLGSQIIQIAGSTGDLISVSADWASSEYMTGVLFRDLGLKQASSSDGWAVDALNIINTGCGFSNVAVYTPGSSSAGGIRLNSCWGVSLRDVQCTGPNSGTTSRGIVLFGSTKGVSTSRGTMNQIRMDNVRANNYARTNVQIGKWHTDDNVGEGSDGGGFLHSVSWTGGQAGSSSSGYGIVFGRCLDIKLDCVHTENNYKSGWYFDDDPNGTDCVDITITRCDSYNDGDDGVHADAADRYGIQVNRGRNINFEGFRFQQSRYGIYVADTTDVDLIKFRDTRFAAHTSGGTTAVNIANSTPSEAKRVIMGTHTFSGTWTNKFVNGGSLSWENISFALPADAATTSTLTITPFTRKYTISNSGATDLNTIAWTSGYTITEGTEISLAFGTGNTTLKDISSGGSANFRLAGAKDFTPAANDSVTVRYRNGEWWETARSLNTTGHKLVTCTNAGVTALAGVTNLTEAVQVNHASSANITSITSTTGKAPYSGQLLVIGFATGNTTLTHGGSTINLENSVDWNPQADDQIILRYHAGSGAWYEVTRTYANSNVTSVGSGTALSCRPNTTLIRCTHASGTSVDTITSTYAKPGQIVTVLLTNSNVDIVTGGNLKLNTSDGDFTTAGADDTITFVHYSGTWYEIKRSANS